MSKTKYSKEDLARTGIYTLIHRESGKRYIGSTSQSFKKRLGEHRKLLRKGKHHSVLLQRAWDKYSEFAFDFVILEFVDPEYCIQREQWWLDLFGTYLPENGSNVAHIADAPMSGKIHSKEVRKKISESRKGKSLSDEHKEKISDSLKGRPSPRKGTQSSEATKKLLSEINSGEGNNFWGKNHSEQVKRKIADSHSLCWLVFPPEGESFVIKNLKQFCRENSLSSDCLVKTNGYTTRFHKGYRVEKLEQSSKKPPKFNPKYIYTLVSPNGEIIETKNLTEFAKSNDLISSNLFNVLNGKRKSHKGWHSITQRLKEDSA